jgi:hypothetical protein
VTGATAARARQRQAVADAEGLARGVDYRVGQFQDQALAAIADVRPQGMVRGRAFYPDWPAVPARVRETTAAR